MNINSKIHEQIMGEYRVINNKRDAEIKDINAMLYAAIPRVKQIDDEIAMLAVSCAKLVITEKITPEQAVEKMNCEKAELLNERHKLVCDRGLLDASTVKCVCDKCGDTGFVNGEVCDCYRRKLRKIMLECAKNVSGLSFDIDSDIFSNFNINYYSKNINSQYGISPYDNMRSIYREAKNFVSKFDDGADNLFFYGGSGLGKTFLSNCISNELLTNGKSIIYQTSYKLFQFLEDYKFAKINREQYEFVHKSIYDSDLLIIDDLGTEFITSYTCSVFFDVLNTRLINGKKLIISTNLGIGEIEKIYSQRVFSRIIGEFNILGFFGDDIRRIKRNQEG